MTKHSLYNVVSCEDDVAPSKHVAVLTIYKYYLYTYVVQLLVRIIRCTRCTVDASIKCISVLWGH
jgi:hypothetical protein